MSATTGKMSDLEIRLYEKQGPKRILTLDGGGIRGALTLGFLEEIESKLRDQHDNPDLLLCDYFDLIVGTSTGGIIAAGLAIGKSAAEIKDLYLNLGGKIFGRKRKRFVPGLFRLGLYANYDEGPLEEALDDEFGTITIGDQERIKTGLAIVAKRADTFSTWPVQNFMRGRYYNDNAGILLKDLLRATSAAPSFFRAKKMAVNLKGQEGIFIDGGISLANNPGFQALMLATISGYSLNWPLGAKKLMITSVGTGTSTKTMSIKEVWNMRTALWGKKIPDLFMEDAAYFNQTLLQWLSDSPSAREIDRMIGDLRNDTVLGAKPLYYNRYNVRLDQDELRELAGKELSNKQIQSLREMDHAENRYLLAEIGEAAAAKRIEAAHFPAAFALNAPKEEEKEVLEFSTGQVPKFDFQLAVKKRIPIRVCQMDKDFTVETLEGTLSGNKGDYLVVGVRDELYPIKKEIFEETYDLEG